MHTAQFPIKTKAAPAKEPKVGGIGRGVLRGTPKKIRLCCFRKQPNRTRGCTGQPKAAQGPDRGSKKGVRTFAGATEPQRIRKKQRQSVARIDPEREAARGPGTARGLTTEGATGSSDACHQVELRGTEFQ